jgi:hypothetical protein
MMEESLRRPAHKPVSVGNSRHKMKIAATKVCAIMLEKVTRIEELK